MVPEPAPGWPRPLVPALPLGVTELAPKRMYSPVAKPSELAARFSKFMNGVPMDTGAACTAPIANKAAQAAVAKGAFSRLRALTTFGMGLPCGL